MYEISALNNGESLSIRGDIAFNEKTGDGTDWRSILRPLVFNQRIKLTATYQDGSEEKTLEYYAQDDLPQNDFYLMLTHDGEGGGSFEIINEIGRAHV